jgi:hypothetical protein
MPKLPKNNRIMDIADIYLCFRDFERRNSISHKLKKPNSKPVHANDSISTKSNQIGIDKAVNFR